MKKNFEDWFKNYIKENVKIKIFDKELKEKFKKIPRHLVANRVKNK